MIRSEIRTEFLRLMDDTAQIKFSTTVANDWIDLGVADMMAQLGLDTAVATIALVGSDTFSSSEPNYQLPSTAMNIKDVYIQDTNSNEQRFRVYDQEDLNGIFGTSWRATTEVGVPTVVYRADYNVLGVHPRPNASYNGRTLRVFYDRMADDLASDSTAPVFINALHDALTMYAVSRGHDLLGNIAKSAYYLKRYQDILNRHKHKQQRFANDMNGFRWV